MADTIFGNPDGGKPAESTQETPAAETSTQQDVNKPAEQSQADPYSNLLTDIRTDDGRQKYATVSDAINSIPHAQEHIKSLTQKVKEMEDQLKEAKTVDDLLARTESKQAAKETPSNTQVLDETKIAELLESKLTEREKRIQMEQNISAVTSHLKEAYGDKAEEVYLNKAKEVGLDIDTLNALSARSPKAVLQYFGMTPGASSNSGITTKSSVNTAALGNIAPQEEDPMARFRSSDSELVKKWRKSASKFEG